MLQCTWSGVGHEARLEMFRLLVRAGEDGLNVAELVDHLGMPVSKLSHHLKALVRARLVLQEKQGNQIVNNPNFDALTQTLVFLTDECCKGVGLSVKA